jgi:hypothetical protein
VYGWDTLVLLKHYLDSGLSKAAIARQLGLSRGVIYEVGPTSQPRPSDMIRRVGGKSV